MKRQKHPSADRCVVHWTKAGCVQPFSQMSSDEESMSDIHPSRDKDRAIALLIEKNHRLELLVESLQRLSVEQDGALTQFQTFEEMCAEKNEMIERLASKLRRVKHKLKRSEQTVQVLQDQLVRQQKNHNAFIKTNVTAFWDLHRGLMQDREDRGTQADS